MLLNGLPDHFPHMSHSRVSDPVCASHALSACEQVRISPWGKWNVFAGKFRIRRSLQGFLFHFTVATFLKPNPPPGPSPPPSHRPLLPHTNMLFCNISKLWPIWIHKCFHAVSTNTVRTKTFKF